MGLGSADSTKGLQYFFKKYFVAEIYHIVRPAIVKSVLKIHRLFLLLFHTQYSILTIYTTLTLYWVL